MAAYSWGMWGQMKVFIFALFESFLGTMEWVGGKGYYGAYFP